MDQRIIGLICLALALIAFVVAYDRYQANVDAVRLMNELTQGMKPFGIGEVKPVTPTTTKVLGFVGILLGATGGYLLYQSKQ